MKRIRSRLGRVASRAVVGGFRPPQDPLTSWLGRVRVLGAGEEWPASEAGWMAGIAQINVRELPFVPPSLADVVFVALFMDVVDGRPVPPSNAPNGEGWLLRTYADVAVLHPTDGVVAPSVRPFPLRWERIESDVPCWEDATSLLSDGDLTVVEDDYYNVIGHTADGMKVGGWPSLIQSSISWAPWDRHPADPEFVLQIDSDARTGIVWGDAGVLYLGRGTKDAATWALEWQGR